MRPEFDGYRGLSFTLLPGAAVSALAGSVVLCNCFLVGAFIVAIAGFRRRDRGRAAPLLPKRRFLRVHAPWLVGAAAAVPTLFGGYLGDDYWILGVTQPLPTPFHAFTETFITSFWRPPVFFLGWFYGRLGEAGPFAAHGVSFLLWIATCAMLPAALRALGARPTAAFAGAVLFAASPVGLETTSWITNQFSLMATCSGVALCTFARPRLSLWRPALAGALLSTLGFLSKEDFVIWLAAWAFVVFRAGSGRRDRYGATFVTVLPSLLAVAAVTSIRAVWFGQLEYYKSVNLGMVEAASRWLQGFAAMFTGEPAASYLFPARNAIEFARVAPFIPNPWIFMIVGIVMVVGTRALPPRRRVAAWMVPVALTALFVTIISPFAGAVVFFCILIISPGTRRELPAVRLLVILCGLSLLPSAGFAPFRTEDYGCRLVYNFNIAAFALAGVMLSARCGHPLSNRVAFTAAVTICFVYSQWNHVRHFRAQEVMRQTTAAIAPILAKAPEGSSFIVYGAPVMVDGVLCFRNAIQGSLQAAAGRPDLHISMVADGLDGQVSSSLVDGVIAVESGPSGIVAREVMDRTGVAPQEPAVQHDPVVTGARGSFHALLGNPAAIGARLLQLSQVSSVPDFEFEIPREEFGAILCPTIELERGASLLANAEPSQGAPHIDYLIFAVHRERGRFRHCRIAPNTPYRPEADDGRVRLIFVAAGEARWRLKGIFVAVQ